MTPRQVILILCASYGLDTRATAERLGLSPLTVRWHWQEMLRKWDCRNRTELVALAYRAGVIQ